MSEQNTEEATVRMPLRRQPFRKPEDPNVRAWRIFQSSAIYSRDERLLKNPANRDIALWDAFMAGYNAAQGRS